MMFVKAIVAFLFASLVAAQSDSEVVAVFFLGRHGDRTSKIQGLGIEGSSVLTTLGKNQVYNTGVYFRNRYLNSSSPEYVQNASEAYVINQIYASAPNDNVLGPSSQAFMQGLFPPTQSANLQTLANGTSESDPLDGYQYVLVNGLTSNAPDIIWIAGDQSCPTMTTASKAYYNSTKFLTIQNQTQDFYNKFKPLLSDFFKDSDVGFQSAYNIFDYLNVGYVHNKTIYSYLSSDDLFQLRTLADSQSYDLNYNASSTNASIGGKAIAANILTHLNQTASQSNPNVKITYFVGAYSPMMAFWGISGIANASSNFMGLPDYASTMAFELRRPANTSGFDDLSVRFGFRNGSLPTAELSYFPMFGQNGTDMAWTDFAQAMTNISILSDASWCTVCGSNMTFCTGSSTSSSGVSSSGVQSDSSQGSGLSNAAAGGIGAGVTIGVIALIEGAIALWYLSHRKRSLSPVSSEVGSK